jgi:hypothetical protein
MKDWVCGSHVKKAEKSLLPEMFLENQRTPHTSVYENNALHFEQMPTKKSGFNSLFNKLVQLLIQSSMYTPLCANGSFRIFTHMTLFGALGVSQTTSLSAESTDDLLEFTCCDLHF